MKIWLETLQAPEVNFLHFIQYFRENISFYTDALDFKTTDPVKGELALEITPPVFVNIIAKPVFVFATSAPKTLELSINQLWKSNKGVKLKT